MSIALSRLFLAGAVALAGFCFGVSQADAIPPMPASMPTLNPKLPTLFIIGDSTVKNHTKGEQGWGEVIPQFFDTSKINVENDAIGGRSSRSFINEGRWDQVLQRAKPGDFLLIQWGHNDGGPLAGDNRERGSIRGTGEDTKEVTLTLGANAGKKEVVHTYGWYLRKYIKEARDKGMSPIICSPVAHRPKEEVEPGSEEKWNYVDFAKEVAHAENVPFINLNKIIRSHYVGLKPEEIKEKYFTKADDTHASPAGAELNAQSVVEGIRDLKDCPLKNYLKSDAIAPKESK